MSDDFKCSVEKIKQGDGGGDMDCGWRFAVLDSGRVSEPRWESDLWAQVEGGKRGSYVVIWGKNIPDRANSKCKGPGAGKWACMKPYCAVISLGTCACMVLCGTHLVVDGWLCRGCGCVHMDGDVRTCLFTQTCGCAWPRMLCPHNAGDAIHADYNGMGPPGAVPCSGPVQIYE